MRADLHELLVERPRWAHQARYRRAFVRNRSARAFEDLPNKQSMSKSRYGQKQLSENFGPLLRFLRSNVGRPWRKVHSEMASVLAPTNAVQQHVLDHLHDFLHTDVYESDGVLWASTARRGPEPLDARGRPTFYVHPRTQLLCEHDGRKKAVPNPNVRSLSATLQLRRYKGVWYELNVAPFPTYRERRKLNDVLAGRRVRWEIYTLYPDLRDLWESGLYTVSARPLTKRELVQRLR